MFSCTSFRRATLAKLVGKPFGTCRSLRIISANLPLKDRITSLFSPNRTYHVEILSDKQNVSRREASIREPDTPHVSRLGPRAARFELSQRIHEGFDSAETSCAALICSALFRRLVGGERQRWKNACGRPLVSGDGRSLRPPRAFGRSGSGRSEPFFHHSGWLPERWSSRLCRRQSGTVNSSLTLRPSAVNLAKGR